MKYLNITLLFILLSLGCFAQYKISGRVLSQADTRPVSNASVFISNATIGNKTAADGTFTLANVKPGTYNLVVSILGFEAYDQTVTVGNKDAFLPDITIFPKSITLSEIKIKSNKGTDYDRKRDYDWFKDDFLGKSALARECRILNPEMLDLSYNERTGTLTASSVDFLIIENNALGYRIKYLLKNFKSVNYEGADHSFSYAGAALFEPMKGSDAQQEQWKKKRQETYEGSQLHFLRSAINDRLDAEGFRVLRLAAIPNPERPADSLINANIARYTQLKSTDKKYKDSLSYWTKKSKLPVVLKERLLPTPLNKKNIIKPTDQPGLYALSGMGGALFIAYDKYHHFNAITLSSLNNPDNTAGTLVRFNIPYVFFYANGVIVNPGSIAFEGSWLNDRLAGTLPTDYEPQLNKVALIDSALVKNITTRLKNYTAAHETEKAYLHFDKPYYAAGDTIYFKAYVTTGENHELSEKSGVLHVELIGVDNKVSRSAQLELNDGVTWGDFALPDTLKKGNYRVRAYTNLMRNGGQASFFGQTIAVASAHGDKISESGKINAIPAAVKPDITFFPEGGSLINGVRSKMAFKVIGANGLGIDAHGTILDNESNEVTTFASTHLGMGYFYLTPAEDKSYRAKLIFADGTQDLIDLPKATSNGINMTVTDMTRLFNVKISTGKAWYRNNRNKAYTLMVYSGGSTQSYTVKLDDEEVSIDVVKEELHTGVAKATLFSPTGEPLCERLLFVQKNDQLKLTINSDKDQYPARGKAGIKITAVKSNGEPVSGHFSVSVIDENKVPVSGNSEHTIINNLLLTSELKGYVEDPDYYFTYASDHAAADLDLVMLTHGYRSFEWKQVLDKSGNNSEAVAYLPEKGLKVSGSVTLKGKPVAGGHVKLFSKSGSGILTDTLTDERGRFEFNNLTYNDTTKFVIQASTAAGLRDVNIKFDAVTNTSPAVESNFDLPVADKNSLNTLYANSKQLFDEQDKYGINKKTNMLKEVVVRDKKEYKPLHSQNLNGAGNADQVISNEQLEAVDRGSLFYALRGTARSLHFTQNHRIRSTRVAIAKNGHPEYLEIIIDGLPRQLPESPNDYMTPVDELNVDDVESVEVILGAHAGAIYGSRAAAGALIITTKWAHGVDSYYREAPGIVVFKPKGFYKARQFYTPKYDHLDASSGMKDLRTTIYWNPELKTGQDGNAGFEYYNADGKGTYRIVVEGIDAGGDIGRQVYRYKVN